MSIANPVRKLYSEVLKDSFAPVKYCFAYGSAAFVQRGRSKGKMLDMIFVVDDCFNWHQGNIERNPGHYSLLTVGGARTVCKVQEWTAGVYYNTLIPINGQLIKYGVISTKSFLEDLLSWRWLYISGRLHKPVVVLESMGCKDIERALRQNLKSAALCALLLTNNDRIPEEDFYCSITGLSYQGDFRMYFGEDKSKVKNIVVPHVHHFRELYKPYLEDLEVDIKEGKILKKMDNKSLFNIYKDDLPTCVRDELDHHEDLKKVLSRIVWNSSIRQSCKGIITAGLLKSVRYSSDKVRKMVRSSSATKT